MDNKQIVWLIISLIIICCIASIGFPDATPMKDTTPAGFFAGLCHGYVIDISWMIGFFNKNIGVYEKNNRGRSYDTGFVIGLLIMMMGVRLIFSKSD